MITPFKKSIVLGFSFFIFVVASGTVDAATCVFNTLEKTVPVECVAFKGEALEIKLGQMKAAGSYGAVFSGTLSYDKTEKPVAIKEIGLKGKSEGYESLEGLPPAPSPAETRNEYGILLQLSQIPRLQHYVVSPYAYFEYKNRAYIVMEEGGEPLSKLMNIFRGNEESLNKLAANIFRALKAIHDQGIVHLDLHPGNILVDQENNVKIIDFGFAKNQGSEVTVAGHILWRDPHIYVVKQAYPGYDYFSLGAILFEIMTGKKIYNFVDTSENISKAPVKPETENYLKYLDVYRNLVSQCEVNKCHPLYLIALSLLNPEVAKRISRDDQKISDFLRTEDAKDIKKVKIESGLSSSH